MNLLLIYLVIFLINDVLTDFFLSRVEIKSRVINLSFFPLCARVTIGWHPTVTKKIMPRQPSQGFICWPIHHSIKRRTSFKTVNFWTHQIVIIVVVIYFLRLSFPQIIKQCLFHLLMSENCKNTAFNSFYFFLYLQPFQILNGLILFSVHLSFEET